MLTKNFEEGAIQIQKAVNGISDYTPVTAQCGGHTFRLTKTKISDALSDPELFINCHLQVTEYYEFSAPAFFFDVYNIEAEALGQKLKWDQGVFPEVDLRHHLIQNPSDLDHLIPPNPGKDGRMPFITEVYKRIFDLGFSPALRFCAPLSLAMNLRGVQNFIMDIMTNPQFAHRLLSFLTDDVLTPWIDSLRNELGGNYNAAGADALASIPIIDMRILEEFALAYTLKLKKNVGNVDVRGWWGESKIKQPEELFKHKVTAQTNLLIGMDPDVNILGPERFKQYTSEHDLMLMLGLGVNLLTLGPIKEIVERVKHYVQVGAVGGKFMLFLNDVSPECPPEHVHAAVQACKYFSRQNNIEQEDYSGFHIKKRPDFETWLTS